MLRNTIILLLIFNASCTPYQVPRSSPYASSLSKTTINKQLIETSQNSSRPKILNKKVQVTNVKMKHLPNNRGFWTGFVEGEGEYSLYLNYYLGSKIVKSTKIGSRKIDPNDSPIWFKFNSFFPKQKKYSWKIVAYQ